jgi:hypothetical protein
LPPPLQTIFFIEGGGQTGFDTCWGNGFVTDYNLINQYGLSDPNPFFQTLLTKPYRNKVRLRLLGRLLGQALSWRAGWLGAPSQSRAGVSCSRC